LGKLTNLNPVFGDGVEPAGGEAFVALVETVDRVVLFDVAAGKLEEDDGAVEGDSQLVRSAGERGVGGDDVELLGLGELEDINRISALGHTCFGGARGLVAVAAKRLGGGVCD